MNRLTRFAAGTFGTLALLIAAPLWASAALTPPSLGGAANFVVLGGAGVTCTASTVTGNVGSKLTVTQTPTCHISGNITQGASAVGAWNDFVTAYTTLKGLTCPAANNLTGKPLGGMSPAPGVYCFDTTADLTSGTLTLSGSASDVWVFQVGTGITTGTAQVVMAGTASACNVYWVIGSLATIGTGTKFQGNILAGTAVTFTGTGSSLMGRALAKAEVTMTGTTISGCGGTSAGGGGGGGGGGGDNEDNDHDGDHDNDGNHDGGDHNGGDHNGGDHNGGGHHGGD